MPASIPSHTAAADAAVSANGAASLSERVKGLRLGDQLGGAKSGGGSNWLPWILCLIMAVTWASFAIRAYTSGGWKAIIGKTDDPPGPTAGPSAADKTAKPAGPDVPKGEKVHDGKGNIVAAHQIQVSPIEVSGRIISLPLQEGKFFEKGSILAELDDTPYRAEFEEAKATLASAQARFDELKTSWPREVEQAKAQLEESKALREQFEKDYLRFQDIRERNRNSGVAEKEYDQAKFGYLTQSAKVKQMEIALTLMEGPRKQRIEAAEADVRAAKARFDRSQWRLNNCKIVAPVDGIVLSKRAEVGNLLNALAMNASLNAGICDMADLTKLEVDIDIQERDISKIKVGNRCTVRVDAWPKRLYTARVDRIMPIANSSKAVIPIRVSVRVPRDEEGQFLKPQMGAVVDFFDDKAPPEPKEPPPPKIID